jgi:hypothetical protein
LARNFFRHVAARQQISARPIFAQQNQRHRQRRQARACDASGIGPILRTMICYTVTLTDRTPWLDDFHDEHWQ